MFLKQGNYQKDYVYQETLHFRICQNKNKSQFSDFFHLASDFGIEY